MVAVLSKLLGLQHLQTAQDLVQDTLFQALNTWALNGLPDNPPAWLHRVARNKAIDFIRRNQNFQRNIAPEYRYLLEAEKSSTPDLLFEDEGIQDSVLRMIFACCHPAIPVESQLALALKTLCGLSSPEIARAFLTSEDTITKRIYRAKEKIRIEGIQLELPARGDITNRLNAVLHCLYLMFNEGYNSSHPSRLIREELCEEAIRLAYLLTQNGSTDQPATNALLALFCFQASRLKARLDDKGNIILLQQQDRTLWYQPLIQKGYYFLEKATGEENSLYHLEAGIAYLHTAAPSFEETDWEAIHHLYTVLFHHHPSPFVALNKAIAALYAEGPAAALEDLRKIKDLEQYYLYHTALGEVHLKTGNKKLAHGHLKRALELTRSIAERQLILGKLKLCE